MRAVAMVMNMVVIVMMVVMVTTMVVMVVIWWWWLPELTHPSTCTSMFGLGIGET